MQISWTRLPFRARNRAEFNRGLTDWLGQVFYETLPARGYEVREEQIYTAFRMARALTDGQTLLAEAGAGTGKTFAYLLPAIAYARFRGKPVLVASASGVLQAQLMNPQGDIQTLSRLLDLQVDARLAADPGGYLCKVKGNRFYPSRRMKGWKALQNWAKRTETGARSEVPQVSDELWADVAWDESLPCDTCRYRGTCHLMVARRQYREAGDLVVTDHRLFARDLLTRAEHHAVGQMALLPTYAAVVLDEGHHLPETWQRAQGYRMSARLLAHTLELIASYARRPSKLGEARWQGRLRLENVLVVTAQRAAQAFMAAVLAAADPGEGKQHIARSGGVLAAGTALTQAVEAIQDDLVSEEAMQEETDNAITLRAYQDRLDQVIEALAHFRSPDVVPWVEGEDLWVVPREPLALFAPEHLAAGTPVLFSSATLESAYTAQVLNLQPWEHSQVGVPFNLAQQVLVYEPDAPDGAVVGAPAEGDTAAAQAEIPAVQAVIRAMQGRTLVLLNSLAEVERYRKAVDVPYRVLFEGDGDRGAMLNAFRAETQSVLVGATFWEGVDIPGEPLSCVVIPRLPWPAHDPLIQERRRQATARGEDPLRAVDVPEMLLKLKQGAGRLIRTTQDRGVLALLDPSWRDKPWAAPVDAVLPEGSERTSDLARVAAFCPA